jgi:hypothetical protein
MKEQTLKIFLYSCFVLLFSALGFLVGVLLNVVSLYSDSNSSETYRFLIRTYLFAAPSIPNYLLIAALFAVFGILVIYKWKREYSHTI